MADSELGRALRMMRASRRLTQKALAEELGVSRDVIKHAEGGGKPSRLAAEKLGLFLKMSSDMVIAAADMTAKGG